MKLDQLAIPEIYESSQDFRFFIKWIALCLGRLQYDIENMPDLYDPLRCPSKLLWMLADTMGYKYDDRFPTAYIRLILLYFMSMIRTRGSQDGIILAANTNLAQYRILAEGDANYINFDRLEDTSIPVNTAYVSYNTEAAYIQVTYFADEVPTDACLEYVRPLGMYCFQSAGVRYGANTKISIEAKLANKINSEDADLHSITATHVGHYTRDDYARIQKTHLSENDEVVNDFGDDRKDVYYRNSEAEGGTDSSINPGYRAISSLQLCNNEGVINSLIHSDIFSIGYGPQDVSTFENESTLNKPYNLLYARDDEPIEMDKVTTIENGSVSIRPIPMVAPIMGSVGDAIRLVDENGDPIDCYTKITDGEINVVDDFVEQIGDRLIIHGAYEATESNSNLTLE